MRQNKTKKIELPATEGDKMYFYQLEVCFYICIILIMYLIKKSDTFLWKTEHIVINNPSDG